MYNVISYYNQDMYNLCFVFSQFFDAYLQITDLNFFC